MPRSFLKFQTLPLLAAVMVFFFSGCVYLVIGGIGAVGGYMVSEDTVEGTTEHEADEVWDEAVDVVSVLGLVSEKNEETGMFLADVNGAKVTVVITSLSPNTSKVSVKARKAYLPKISLAQDIFVKIMNRLLE